MQMHGSPDFATPVSAPQVPLTAETLAYAMRMQQLSSGGYLDMKDVHHTSPSELLHGQAFTQPIPSMLPVPPTPPTQEPPEPMHTAAPTAPDGGTMVPLSAVIDIVNAVMAKHSQPHAPTAAPTAITSREADRINLPQFPIHLEYTQWRYGALANIIAASASPVICQRFVDEIADPIISDEQLFTTRSPLMTTLDAKLFSSLVNNLIARPSDDSTRMLVGIRKYCISGCGRQAFRLIDGDYMRDGPKRRQTALEALHALRPTSDLTQIEVTITKLRSILLELQGSGEMPSNEFQLSLLRTLFGDNGRIQAAFTAYDLAPGTPPEMLMKMIFQICTEHRVKMATKRSKEKALAVIAKTPGKTVLPVPKKAASKAKANNVCLCL
jgi:hypothetical protein